MEEEEVMGEPKSVEMNDKRDDDDDDISTKKERPVPLMALNHVSRVCRSVKDSVDFYTNILGFVLVERPQSFDVEGAWLFNYGVGVHLLQSDRHDANADKDRLDPLDNHISFQCEDMEGMEERLKELGVKYKRRTWKEGERGESIEQLFFNDPDGFMIEICNCENLKLVPTGSSPTITLPPGRHNPPLEPKQ